MSSSGLAVTEFAKGGLQLRLIAPPVDLRGVVTGYYRTEVAAGVTIEDWLPPEDGNLRVGAAAEYVAAIGGDGARAVPRAIVSGPTDRATYLRIREGRFWGFGLTPAGWCQVMGRPANLYANRFADVHQVVVPAPLVALLDRLCDIDDLGAAAEAINATLRAIFAGQPAPDPSIARVHAGFADDAAMEVAAHARAAGMELRTFGRFAVRHFGFPPSVLLRRQRFLRSLAQYAQDPSMKWIDSLDSHYHDQAHFCREFRAVMGMTPSAYAALPHPMVTAAVSVIRAQADVAMQALYNPHSRPAAAAPAL